MSADWLPGGVGLDQTPLPPPRRSQRYCDELGCGLDRFVVEPDYRRVVFYVPRSHSADANGAIAIAKRLLADVETVDIFSGRTPDLRHRKIGGMWENFLLSAGAR